MQAALQGPTRLAGQALLPGLLDDTDSPKFVVAALDALLQTRGRQDIGKQNRKMAKLTKGWLSAHISSRGTKSVAGMNSDGAMTNKSLGRKAKVSSGKKGGSEKVRDIYKTE